MPRIAAAVLLVLLAPVLAVLAVLVWLSMGKPVLFRQERSGKDGRTFTLVKFRSMRDASDAAGNPLPDEQRLTSLGRLLRRFRLDELPGLWNVVTGDLAFVGPRPLLPLTISGLGCTGAERGKVKPGLTGWAQVNGFRGEIKREDQLRKRIEHDIWYLEHWNPWLDIRIIFLTLYITFKGDKNAF